MKSVRHLLLVLSISIVAAFPAQAQTFGGQAVNSTSGDPLVGLDVRLLQHRDGLAVAAIVDSTKTDERGLFEFRVSPGGVYQAEFGPRRAPYSLGPVDTVASDRILRRYVVPLPVAIVAFPPADDSTIVPGRTVPARLPAAPGVFRLGARTAAGALIGGAAGFIVAELRCGRIRGCEPSTSFPYYPGGATVGAAIGSGTSALAADCRLGFLRGLAGSVLGSLGGSLLGGAELRGKHAAAAVGSAVGAFAMVSTCRLG